MRRLAKNQYLTRAEEEIMQIIWDMKNAIVKDIRMRFDEPRPARNTVSTVVRVLEKKGFVGHKAYGNTHLYHPLVSKEEYSKRQLNKLLAGYFDNSFSALASFFAKEQDLSISELEELLEDTKKQLAKKKKNK
jgi:predicted transcriptional regulator